jgi:protein-tyrosine phosphatase
MIDIHCHILPQIDDGPGDTETSMRMAEIAVSDGITHMVATPHFTYNEKPTTVDISRGVNSLGDEFDGAGLPLRLLSGADVRLTYELLGGMERRDIPTINGSRYFLLELPAILPPNLGRVFSTADSNGYVPIITHPERNYTLLSSPGKLETLRRSGVLFQLTAMSVTGEFGEEIKQLSHLLIRRGYADFIATDAHDPLVRVPVLSRACKAISRLLDRKRTDRILVENPADVLADREIRAD